MVIKPLEVSTYFGRLISEVILDFHKNKKYSEWEHHIRYHDEPIWILQRQKGERIQSIQLALFDTPEEGLSFHIIPDDSKYLEEERINWRRKNKRVISERELKELEKKDAKKKLSESFKMIIESFELL